MEVITVLDEINVQTRGRMTASATQITAGAEAFGKLANMGPISVGSVRAFGAALGVAIAEIAAVARQYSGAGLAFAQGFAESAGKIVGIIGPAVDGLNKLRTLADAVPGMFLKFANYMSYAVFRISEVANNFNAAGLTASSRFTETAGKVVSILSTGVDGINKLATLADAVPGMFLKFAQYIYYLVMRITEVSTLLSTQALASASAFAETAGKVVGIIGSGVDGFAKLATFKGASDGAMTLFASAVGAIVGRIIVVSQQFAAEAVVAAGTFAESAGKVVGIIGSGVDGFSKLKDFGPISDASLAAFALTVWSAVSLIASLATTFTTEALAAASAFADGAGKVLGIIANGVTGLNASRDVTYRPAHPYKYRITGGG